MKKNWKQKIYKLLNIKVEFIKMFNKKFQYDEYMDKECVDICNVMNSLKGIKTIESCCGHNKSEYKIYFKVTDSEGLFFLTRCVDNRYWKYGNNWRIELLVGDFFEDNHLPIIYLLTSIKIKGYKAYRQIEKLIENMNYHLNDIDFIKGYNLNIDSWIE